MSEKVTSVTGLFDSARREPLLRLRDNPILIAQLRAQLRQKRALGVIQIAGLLSLLILFVTYSYAGLTDAQSWSKTAHVISWMIFYFLYWRGAAYLMEAVSSERESGIFIFLRSSPMTSLTVAFGYLVGGASRAYVGALTLAAPWLISSSLAGHSLGALLLALALVFTGALTLHSLVLLLALSGRGRIKATLKIAFILLYFISDSLCGVGLYTVAHLTSVPALSSLGLSMWGEQVDHTSVAFYSMSISSLLYTLIVQGLALSSCMWIASRKIEREAQPSVSRAGGLILCGLIATLVMGVDLNPSALNRLQAFNVSFGYLPGGGALLTLSLAAGIWLLVSSTPSLISFQRASAREARRVGGEPSTLLPWRLEGASLLGFCSVYVGCVTGLVCVYFVLHGGFEALKVALQAGLTAGILSVVIALFAISGLSEHASALARQQSYSLTLWVRLLTIFLLPLILALVSYQLQLRSLVELCACLSPVYSVFYALVSFGTREGSLSAQATEGLFSFSWPYFTLSLAVGAGVSAWSYQRARVIKRALITGLS